MGVILVTALAVIAGAMTLFTVVAKLAPETARGPLIEWIPDYEVSRAKVMGGEVYVDVSTSRSDALTALFLGGTGAVTAWVAARLRQARMLRQSTAFGLLAGAAWFLAVDELLAVHETVGLNLPVMRRLPGVSHPDDAIVAAYAAAAVAFAWWARFLVRGHRWARRILLAALLAIVAAAAADLTWVVLPVSEEKLEILAAFLVLAGLVVLALAHLRRAGDCPRPAAE